MDESLITRRTNLLFVTNELSRYVLKGLKYKCGGIDLVRLVIYSLTKLPEIPVEMSVCDGSDVCENFEYLQVKQETMEIDNMKSEELPPKFESDESHDDSQDVPTSAQLQNMAQSGEL